MYSHTVDRVHVNVITERRSVTGNRWLTERWQALGVVPCPAQAESGRRLIHQDAQSEQYLWSGFPLDLYRDEAESYYYNLLSRQPSIFVVCHRDEGGEVIPFLISASHYEAEAYMEAGEAVFAVAMPPDIHRRVERYVVENYVPREGKGRRRDEQQGDAS